MACPTAKILFENYAKAAMEHFEAAKAHRVVASRAVLRNLPAPLRKSIGDFSNKEKALVSLGLFDFDNLRLA